MKNTFKRIISMVLVCMMLVGTLAGISVSAETAAPTVEIVSKNLAYGETIKLMYAVKAENVPEGATVTVTLTDKENNTYEAVADGTVEIDGVTYLKFVSERGVPAQNIDAQFTATAAISGTEATDVETYSVLQYLWERLYVSTNVTDAQKAMYNALLAYAKAADVVLNGSDSISGLTYVVLNGVGEMYNVGDEIELITDLVAGEGQELVWTVNGETYTEATYVVTNEFANIAVELVGEIVDPEEPAPEEPEVPEWTVADALQAEDGTEVVLTATVESIYQAYSEQYNNISVYLTDETGERIIAFRMTGNVYVGDVITVTGTITTYAATGVKQFAQGCTFEMVEAHNCEDYATTATCTAASVCSSCGTELAPALTHPTDEDNDGVCDNCGVGTDVEVKTEKLAIIANTGVTGTKTISWAGEAITFTNNQASSTTSIRTSDSNHFRCYKSSEVVISSNNGEKITQIIITATGETKYKTPWKTSLEAAGYTVTVEGDNYIVTFEEGVTSITITASAQIRLSAIEVTYTA